MHLTRLFLVVSILLSFAAQAVQTIYWNTPLQEAAWKGDAPVVERLLEEAATDQAKAAEILKETEDGLNALHMAVVTGQNDVIRLLLRSPFYALFLRDLGRQLNLPRKPSSWTAKWPTKETLLTIMEEAPEWAYRLCELSPAFSEYYWVPARIMAGQSVPNAFIDNQQAALLRTMFRNLRDPNLQTYEDLLADSKEFLEKPYGNKHGLERIIEIVYDFITLRKAAVVIVVAVQAYINSKSSLTHL